MNLYSFVSFVVGFILLNVGLSIFKTHEKNITAIVLSLFLLVCAVWNFFWAFFSIQPNQKVALMLWAAGMSTSSLSIPFYQYLIMLFVDRKELFKHWWFHALIWAPILPFLILPFYGVYFETLKMTSFGWAVEGTKVYLAGPVYMMYSLLIIIAGLIFMLRYTYRSRNELKKRQMKIFLVIIINTSGGIFFIACLQYFFQFPVMNISNWLPLVIAWGFTRMIRQHRFLPFTPRQAANGILENLKDIVILCDPERCIVSVNKGGSRILESSELDMIGKKIEDIVLKSDYLKLGILHEPGLSSPREIIIGLLNSSGDAIPVKMRVQASISSSDQIEGYIMVGTDLREEVHVREVESARIQSVKELGESRALYYLTIDSLEDFIHVTDENHIILLANRSLKEYMYKNGYPSEVEGLHIMKAFPFLNELALAEHRGVFQSGKVLVTREKSRVSGRYVYTETKKIPIIQDGFVTRLITVIRDITLETRNQENLVRMQKLESLGVLAGGIGHDFNNILAGILGNIDLALKNTDIPESVSDLLSDAAGAAEKAGGLTRQLLTFSRGGAPVMQSGWILNLLDEMISFILRGTEIELERKYDPRIKTLDMDSDQISNVFQNILLNARQALSGKGKLVVKADIVECDPSLRPFLPKGKYVRISFHDNGPGIASSSLPKIFDPYYTTRESGTGLGLAVSYSIARQHSGMIDVISDKENGSDFIFYLPFSNTKKIVKEKKEKTGKKMNVSILFMDDEDFIRKLINNTAEEIGCSCVTVSNGKEALAEYRKAVKKKQPFDLVFLDLTVHGGMGGLETLKELLKIDPKCKAVVCSGYSDDTTMARYIEYGFSGQLPKPFRLSQMKDVIRKVLKF